MIRMGAITVLAGLLCAACAMADEESDRTAELLMGNYSGAFTGDAWRDRTIRAQVIAESKVGLRAVLYIGAGDGEPARVEVQGKCKDGKAELDGDVDLGAALGGAYKAAVQMADQKMQGTLKGKGKPVEFSLERVFQKPPTLGQTAPAGAVTLFDGSNLDKWVREPEKWCLTDEGAMEVCGSSLRTREEYGSGLYHVEFRTPFMPHARGQARGNSGVYLLGKYEMQVLDSFGEPPRDNEAGGIYKQAVPLKNASLPPLEWQAYDIEFTAAKFDAAGNKVSNARITAHYNGELIHDDRELTDRTPGGMDGPESAAGFLYLQDHGNQVRFRNIWFQPVN